MKKEYIKIELTNVDALCPADFEELEDMIALVMNKEGFEGKIYDSVTGNTTTVRNDENFEKKTSIRVKVK